QVDHQAEDGQRLGPRGAAVAAHSRRRGDRVRRRAFITLLGGAVAAWPLAAGAQEPEPVRRIGVLLSLSADDPQGQARLKAFVLGLQPWGWAQVRNLALQARRGA